MSVNIWNLTMIRHDEDNKKRKTIRSLKLSCREWAGTDFVEDPVSPPVHLSVFINNAKFIGTPIQRL